MLATGDGWVHVLATPADAGRALLAGLRVELDAGAYERDLGMPTLAAVERQLRVDLPRCVATVGGARTVHPARVLDATLYPRLCTQAGLAPVVEWLLHADVVPHEVGAPLRVAVDAGDVDLAKPLGLRTWDGAPRAAVAVRLRLRRGALAVALERLP